LKDCKEDSINHLKQYIAENKESINIAGVGITSGLTMLHTASKLGECELIDYLIKNGADLQIKNHEQQTALQFGVQNKKVESIVCLLKHYDNLSNSRRSIKNIKIEDIAVKSINKTIPVAFILFTDNDFEIISSESLSADIFTELLEWAKNNDIDLEKIT